MSKKIKTRIYGHDKTIHRTNHLDIETDKKGNVIMVWFRCQPLPFIQVRSSARIGFPVFTKLHAVVVEDAEPTNSND